MASPVEELEKVWTALHTNSDRITELEAIVNTRNEILRETITSAVQEAMPKALLSDEQHEYVNLAFQRWKDRAALHKKIIESTAIWAVPMIILAALVLLGEGIKTYMITHGMWRP